MCCRAAVFMFLLAISFCQGQPEAPIADVRCTQGADGSRVCAGTVYSTRECGRVPAFKGSPEQILYCRDVVVEKTTREGARVFRRILTADSDNVAVKMVLDDRNDIVLVGGTYSAKLPTTPDAFQKA